MNHSEPIIFDYCNIYNNTKLGKGVKVGAYTEISGAIIGDNVTIGAKCFIPEKVLIDDNAWIGPGVFFTHDFPPTTREDWKQTIVGCGAMIGSNVTIKGGVRIGRNAVIGCGAVVTKDVPDGETWAGNPARKLRDK